MSKLVCRWLGCHYFASTSFRVMLGLATADEDLNTRVKYWYEAML
jgi:hypothetical protein